MVFAVDSVMAEFHYSVAAVETIAFYFLAFDNSLLGCQIWVRTPFVVARLDHFVQKFHFLFDVLDLSHN